MQEELEKILTNLHDAGCENAGAVGWKNSTRVSGKWTAWIS